MAFSPGAVMPSRRAETGEDNVQVITRLGNDDLTLLWTEDKKVSKDKR